MSAPHPVIARASLSSLPPERTGAGDGSVLTEQDSGQGSAATSFVVEWQLT